MRPKQNLIGVMPAKGMNMKSEPLVLCLTNTVAATFTANCLLAIGARPAMVEDPAEAETLARTADALLVNLGTVTVAQAEVMRAAVRAANACGTPWVLDPVGVQLLPARLRLARELLRHAPAIVRGNRAEIDCLGATGAVTLATDAVDAILSPDGTLAQEIDGGVPMLQRVTATGCAQGGICAALLGRGLPPTDVVCAASRLMKRAGERAWAQTQTPGSFQSALIDALYLLGAEVGGARAKGKDEKVEVEG